MLAGSAFRRFSAFLLLWTLVCASVSGQEKGVLGDPMRPYSQAGAAAERGGPPYQISGVVISPSRRVALINGTVSSEGDRVGDAEILAIDAGAVRLRTGSRELTVYLGSDAVQERPMGPATAISRPPAPRQSEPEPSAAADSAPSEAPVLATVAPDRHYGPVQRGETLSGVASQHLPDGVTLNQMMIAVFEANPQAFSGNINVLHEGAVLRMPAADEVRQGSPAVAAAEVARQHIDWHGNSGQSLPPMSAATHGPVTSGETLSSVALRHLSDGITLNQMMIALFEANPRAFSGNINVLHEGAVLRIPDQDEVRRASPQTAAAEVARQHTDWRDHYRRQSLANAAVRGTYDPVTGGELLSITAVP